MNGKIAAILLALVSACTIVEVLDVAEVEPQEMPKYKVQTDTTQRDTTQRDTIRIPIGFEVKVEEWEDINTTL